jgi:hypothetical protein
MSNAYKNNNNTPTNSPVKDSIRSIPKLNLLRKPISFSPFVRRGSVSSTGSNDSEKLKRIEMILKESNNSSNDNLQIEDVIADAIEVTEDVVEVAKKAKRKVCSLFKSCTCISVKGSAI